jgi:hypothetical protein
MVSRPLRHSHTILCTEAPHGAVQQRVLGILQRMQSGNPAGRKSSLALPARSPSLNPCPQPFEITPNHCPRILQTTRAALATSLQAIQVYQLQLHDCSCRMPRRRRGRYRPSNRPFS